MSENYYRILGLNDFADSEEIKRAYRSLAKKYHPDTPTGSEEKFKRISLAYQKLSDPRTKEIVDNWIKRPHYTSNQQYNRPRYTKRTRYYTTERKTYSEKVKLYASLATAVFLIIAITIPLVLSYKASNYHYEEGIRLTEEGDYYNATTSFNTAISWLGQRSSEASIYGTRVSLYKLKSITQAKYFINKGLEHSSDDEINGELQYLLGIVYKEQNEIELALKAWDLSSRLGYNKDSIALNLGILNAFYLENYDDGLSYFNDILNGNPLLEYAMFGKAWCLQKLNRPLKSIRVYDSLLENYPKNALGHFFRGHNNIVLGDTLKACGDFQTSWTLGYEPAEVYINLQCKNYRP